MLTFSSKPTDKLIKDYYAVLGQYGHLNVEHESAVRSAFQSVLRGYSKKMEWTLVPEYAIQKDRTHRIVVDGALLDFWKQRRGFWEAKDEHDDLEREIKLKLEKGYPRTNIIFQAPERAIIFQHGVRQGLNEDITDPKNLSDLLTHFFSYREPDHEEWDSAVAEFKERIPELADRAQHLIEAEKKGNRSFRESFDAFYSLCRQAINPNLSEAAVEKMLIQHLLTERIFRRVFHAEEFRNRNVIASEIEKVIQSMTSRHFSRDQFLSELDRFYKAIERAADDKDDYSEKQAFLNTVYERFFQGFSRKEADTHGIVYTPQPIVDFMVRSVDDILKKEFGKSLAEKGVHILDPFVGTGNFITRAIRQIGESRKSALPHKFEHELHCNEIMLLPYYIASMNIEHEYMEQTGQYKPFEGICLVDTFDMRAQATMFTEKNLERIERQRSSPIFVVIGNPPYNAWQENENDNNKNRRYLADAGVDTRIAKTYAKASKASNKNALSDPYVKAIRWASDRVGKEGIVAFVTNSGFVDGIATDGMRKQLAGEFDQIYILDLGGNVRKNPKLSGTTHNVFGIQVGVSINIFVRRDVLAENRKCKIFYASTEEFWTRQRKEEFLVAVVDRNGVNWRILPPDEKGNWLTEGLNDDYSDLLPIASQDAKANSSESGILFQTFSRGAETTRDAWCYNFSVEALSENVGRFVKFYNAEVQRWLQTHTADDEVDSFLASDASKIKWCSKLKQSLEAGTLAKYQSNHIRIAIYRPFSAAHLYFDDVIVHRRGRLPQFFPSEQSEAENRIIALTGQGSEKPFLTLSARTLVDLHLAGPGCSTQCFPFYTYDEDGSNRRENITNWALEEFRNHYNDATITKWDIFHYAYALLHSAEYRVRYAANLKRELPRIPYAPNFRAFAEAGKRLGELHVNYQQQPEYSLEQIWKPGSKLDMRAEKMRLGKDKTSLIYNDSLILSGIPAETFEYRLGNRSALEWIIDQYQVFTDKRSGITNDPNREVDPEYILRLIGQVIYVSLETVKIVKALPGLNDAKTKEASGR
jgi:predicted helicase